MSVHTASHPRTLAEAARELVVELHAVLSDLDPARWRTDVAAATRARLVALQARISEILESAGDNGRLAAVRTYLGELRQTIGGLPGAGAGGDHDAAAEEPREEWMALRERLLGAYENLALALKAEAIHVPELRPTNYQRNLLHIATALTSMTVALLLPSAGWAMVVAGALAGTCWTLEITRRIWPAWNDMLMAALGRFAHPHESHRVNSSTWYMTGLFLLTLTGSMPLLAVAMAVLGLGDPAAALIGRRFGRTKLLHGRSLEGTVSFVVFGTLAATALLALVSPLTLGAALPVAAGAATTGAIAELLSHRIDDNLSVPLASAAGAMLVASLMGLVV